MEKQTIKLKNIKVSFQVSDYGVYHHYFDVTVEILDILSELFKDEWLTFSQVESMIKKGARELTEEQKYDKRYDAELQQKYGLREDYVTGFNAKLIDILKNAKPTNAVNITNYLEDVEKSIKGCGE